MSLSTYKALILIKKNSLHLNRSFTSVAADTLIEVIKYNLT